MADQQHRNDGSSNEKVVYATALDQGTVALPSNAVAGTYYNPNYDNGAQNQTRLPGQGIQYDSNGQPVYNQQPGVGIQPTAPIYARNAQGINYNGQRTFSGPPMEVWRDGICDCCNNLWPSCWCSMCCHGAWLLAQIAEKTKFTSFKAVIIPYIVASILCYIISLFFNPLIAALPALGVLVLSIIVRIHVAKMYNIRTNGACGECITGLCCCCCSLSQRYKKVLDGDSDPSMPDYYDQA